MFTTAKFTIAKRGTQRNCPINRWMNRQNVHTYNKLSVIKRNAILIYATIWINHRKIMLSEIKDKYCIIHSTYMRYLKGKFIEWPKAMRPLEWKSPNLLLAEISFNTDQSTTDRILAEKRIILISLPSLQTPSTEMFWLLSFWPSF